MEGDFEGWNLVGVQLLSPLASSFALLSQLSTKKTQTLSHDSRLSAPNSILNFPQTTAIFSNTLDCQSTRMEQSRRFAPLYSFLDNGGDSGCA